MARGDSARRVGGDGAKRAGGVPDIFAHGEAKSSAKIIFASHSRGQGNGEGGGGMKIHVRPVFSSSVKRRRRNQLRNRPTLCGSELLAASIPGGPYVGMSRSMARGALRAAGGMTAGAVSNLAAAIGPPAAVGGMFQCRAL